MAESLKLVVVYIIIGVAIMAVAGLLINIVAILLQRKRGHTCDSCYFLRGSCRASFFAPLPFWRTCGRWLKR